MLRWAAAPERTGFPVSRPGRRHAGHRAASLVCLAAGCLLLGPVASLAQEAQSSAQPASVAAEMQLREAMRDSLRQEIHRYSDLIQALRDSLELPERHEPSQQWVADLEDMVGSLNDAVGSIADQLAELQLEIDAGQVSLRDRHGGRVTLDLPTDLGERISQGIASITQVILDEIPDTLRIHEGRTGLPWPQVDHPRGVVSTGTRRSVRSIDGDLIKFNDDLTIAADEVVRGDVVVLFGDINVQGRVEGALVAVLGNVELTETAVVDGEVTVVLGRLDRRDRAQTGSVTVINPGEGILLRGVSRQPGIWMSFWAWQFLFLLTLGLVLLLVALAPRTRLDAISTCLRRRPAASIGLGALLLAAGHLAVVGLAAILVLTVIGIPVALLLLLVLALFDLVAIGAAAVTLGHRLCAMLNLPCSHPVGACLVGLVALHVPAFLAALASAAGLTPLLALPLAWTGNLVKLAAVSAGLGALILSRLGSSQEFREFLPADHPTPGVASS